MILKNLIACQNHNLGGIKTLFDTSLSLIAENSFEVLNLSTMMYDVSPWMRMTLCNEQAIKWAKAKVHVNSDSGLCMGRVHGEQIDFEWNIFPGFTAIAILRHIQQDLNARRINPDQFEGMSVPSTNYLCQLLLVGNKICFCFCYDVLIGILGK